MPTVVRVAFASVCNITTATYAGTFAVITAIGSLANNTLRHDWSSFPFLNLALIWGVALVAACISAGMSVRLERWSFAVGVAALDGLALSAGFVVSLLLLNVQNAPIAFVVAFAATWVAFSGLILVCKAWAMRRSVWEDS